MEENCTNKTVQGEIETTTEANDSLEVFIDEDYISIPRDRYEELIRAETTLEMVRRLIRTLARYNAEEPVKVLLGLRVSAEED